MFTFSCHIKGDFFFFNIYNVTSANLTEVMDKSQINNIYSSVQKNLCNLCLTSTFKGFMPIPLDSQSRNLCIIQEDLQNADNFYIT